MPRFTIVTITYQDAVGLASTIRSVGAQTFRDFEYVVQDGAINDRSTEIVKGFRDWVDVYNNEPDGGIYDAMNKALEHCSGDYTLFMNSSDIFAGSTILEQTDRLLVDGDEIVHGHAMDVDSNEVHRYNPLNKFHFGMVFDHQAVFVKTDLLKELKFDDSLRIAGDLDFFSRCRERGISFRDIDLIVAKKPYAIGASSGYLDRFPERKMVLLRNFPQQEQKIKAYLRAELLKFADRELRSDAINKKLQTLELDDILLKVKKTYLELAEVFDLERKAA